MFRLICRSSEKPLLCFSQRNSTTVLSPLEQKYFPHIGNREIVGFGRSGVPVYCDDITHPYPSIRFKNHSPEIEALQTKEKQPWSKLTIDEAKTLYRYSFRQTLAEASAPNGIWKIGIGYGFVFIGFSCLLYAAIREFLLSHPKSVIELPEYKEAIKYKQVFSRSGNIEDVHNFDIHTKRWRE